MDSQWKAWLDANVPALKGGEGWLDVPRGVEAELFGCDVCERHTYTLSGVYTVASDDQTVNTSISVCSECIDALEWGGGEQVTNP
jgi:hypothetical protein